MEFEFNFNDLYTILYILDDAKSYEVVYRQNNLTLYQIKLKNKTYVNVMLEFSDTQALSYVYGFSNEEFMDIAFHLGHHNLVLKYDGITLTKDTPRLTNYNDKMVFFAPLITPFRMGGRR